MFYWKLGSEKSLKYHLFKIILVLILVLLEVGFWEPWIDSQRFLWNGLNPCFTGSWVLRARQQKLYRRKWRRLNPCFTGSWVLSMKTQQQKEEKKLVLILVLLEVGFWEFKNELQRLLQVCLNPCFTGSWVLRDIWNCYSHKNDLS